MIVDLPSTTTAAVSKKLVRLRNDVGAMALGRVLTLLIIADESDADEAIEAANDASRRAPLPDHRRSCTGNKRGASRLDAQIRVGGDAGASEVVVLRLYGAPRRRTATASSSRCCCRTPPSWPGGRAARRGDVSADPIGAMAQRRITDAAEARNPRKEMQRRRRDLRARRHRPGLDPASRCGAACSPPRSTSRRTSRSPSATVTGGSDSPSTDLLAGWLAQTLRCPVTRARTRAGTGMVSVRLERRSGDHRPGPRPTASSRRSPNRASRYAGSPSRGAARGVPGRRAAPARPRRDLRRVADRGGRPRSAARRVTASEAIAEGEAPSIEEARKQSRRVAQGERTQQRCHGQRADAADQASARRSRPRCAQRRPAGPGRRRRPPARRRGSRRPPRRSRDAQERAKPAARRSRPRTATRGPATKARQDAPRRPRPRQTTARGRGEGRGRDGDGGGAEDRVGHGSPRPATEGRAGRQERLVTRGATGPGVVVHRDKQLLADAAAARLVTAVVDAQAARGRRTSC